MLGSGGGEMGAEEEVVLRKWVGGGRKWKRPRAAANGVTKKVGS